MQITEISKNSMFHVVRKNITAGFVVYEKKIVPSGDRCLLCNKCKIMSLQKGKKNSKNISF